MSEKAPIPAGPEPPESGQPVPICQYGEPVLRQRARPVRRINAAVRALAKRMAEAMYAVNGVGLAAPQIGEPRRVITVDTGDELLTLINPRLVGAEGRDTDVEACLSVVGLCGEVERYEKVIVRALDLKGKEITVEGEGFLARVLQHELDHLDGVLFVDRATSVSPVEKKEEAADGGGAGDETDGDEEPSDEAPTADQEAPRR